jgi:putative glycerol-1-phosphate prenyltransferase
MIYDQIIRNLNKKKFFGLLIDPENYAPDELEKICQRAGKLDVDFILVGGSLVSVPMNQVITGIKKHCSMPVLLFPGNYLQISDQADAILLLSLISGRNPEYLIGQHVMAAPLLKKSALEIIPTSYILIGDQDSSVAYLSNTRPIPAGKHDIVLATAQAGEMLGHKLLYLEAGSGANQPVPEEIIKKTKEHVDLPVIVGGGIKDPRDAARLYKAGADMLVVGNAAENNPGMLDKMVEVRDRLNH